MAVDAFRIVLDRAGKQAPDDDRVWLGWANLAIRTGQFDEAPAVARCLPPAPAGGPGGLAGGARLGAGHGSGRAGPPGPDASAGRTVYPGRNGGALRLVGGAAGRHDTGERQALERLVQVEPGHCPAWERLAVLATQAGRNEDAVQLRRRKTGMDQVKDRSRSSTIGISLPTDVPELARLAEALGHRFEAVGFLTWIVQRDPATTPPGPPCPPQMRSKPARSLGPTPGPAPCRGTRPGCRPCNPPSLGPRAAHPEFRDDALAAGLTFVYENGESSLHQLPEFAGGGVGLIDYDGDGWLDVYLVQGGRFPPIRPTATRRPPVPQSPRWDVSRT